MSLGKSFGRCCFLLFEEVGGAECEIVGTQLRRQLVLGGRDPEHVLDRAGPGSFLRRAIEGLRHGPDGVRDMAHVRDGQSVEPVEVGADGGDHIFVRRTAHLAISECDGCDAGDVAAEFVVELFGHGSMITGLSSQGHAPVMAVSW